MAQERLRRNPANPTRKFGQLDREPLEFPAVIPPKLAAGRFDITVGSSDFSAESLKGEKHPGKPCEDYVLAFNTSGKTVVAVFDGAGGGRYAAEMSYKAAKQIKQVMVGHLGSGDVGRVLRYAFTEANAEVRDENRGYTTATVAVVDPEAKTLHLASSGNTRAYLVRGSDVNRLTSDGGVGSLQLDMLGSKDEIEVEVRRIPYRPGDILLICTDGIHERLPDRDLNDALTSNKDPRRLVAGLIAESRRHLPELPLDDQTAAAMMLT